MEYAEALARIAEASAKTNGKPDAIQRIVEETAAIFHADMASVFHFRENGSLKHVAGIGLPPLTIHKLEDISNSRQISALLDKSSPPVIAHTTGTYRKTAAGSWADFMGVATIALASLPMQSDDKRHGLLVLCHKAPYEYPPNDLAILRILAVLVTPVVIKVSQGTSEQMDTSKSQLFSVLSHELRTPLTSIMGFTQLIRKRLSASAHSDRRTMEQLDMLWAQAQRLNRLIDAFVDLNRIERGEFEITRGQVEVTSLLRGTAEGLSQAGSHHTIQMDLPDQEVWVYGDSKRLEQVFNHILANALKYAPLEQPIKVSCEADAGEGTVIIRITDRGPGIPAARLKEIFDRTYPGGPLKSGGLGVGLYLSKVIVEAHGGRISIQSSSAKGTVVEIVLPA